MIARPSCYNCEYAGYNITADIRVADFWATRGKYKEMDDNKGISSVLINSEKGKQLFDEIKNEYIIKEIPYEDALLNNHLQPVTLVDTRQKIFRELKEEDILTVLGRYKKKKKKTRIQKLKKKIPKPIKKAIKKIIK